MPKKVMKVIRMRKTDLKARHGLAYHIEKGTNALSASAS